MIRAVCEVKSMNGKDRRKLFDERAVFRGTDVSVE